MLRRHLLPLVLGTCACAAFADEKLSAELDGLISVSGFSDTGAFITPSATQVRAIHGKVQVVAEYGEVRRIETYTEWSGPNEIRGKMWERLYVSGGEYAGWVESSIETVTDRRFSRTVIEGEIEQEIRESGRGFIEWTTLGADNEIVSEATDDEDDNANDPEEEPEPLPTIEITEDGEFDGVSNRRIEIGSDGEVTFTVTGFERFVVDGVEVFVDQDAKLRGEADGGLDYNPDDIPDSDDGEDVTPTPTPGVTPSPTPGFDPGFDDPSDDIFDDSGSFNF